MNKVSIAYKAHNRPIYAYQSLVSLSRNCQNYGVVKMLNDTKTQLSITISIDKDHSANTMMQMLAAIDLVGIKQSMIDVKVVMRPKNLGCGRHTSKLFEEIWSDDDPDYLIHVEDDHLLSSDAVYYFLSVQDVLDEQNFFAACSFHRACHQFWENGDADSYVLVSKRWFDGSGPIAFTRKTWDKIQQMGGMFSVNQISQLGRSFDCRGETWLKEINKSDAGSWVWPMHKYFQGDQYCLFPKISRSQNIGQYGLHVHSSDQHSKIQKSVDTIDEYTPFPTFDVKNIERQEHKFVEHGIES